MVFKKLVVLLILLLCVGTVSAADSISDFEVPPTVYLNQGVTASGLLNNEADNNGDVLCAMAMYDSNSKLVTRASDQYTLATGRFYFPPFEVTEPLFSRGETYTLEVVCDDANARSNFYVEQRQEALKVGGFWVAPQSMLEDLQWWTVRDNGLTMALFLVVIVLAGLFVWFWMRG